MPPRDNEEYGIDPEAASNADILPAQQADNKSLNPGKQVPLITSFSVYVRVFSRNNGDKQSVESSSYLHVGELFQANFKAHLPADGTLALFAATHLPDSLKIEFAVSGDIRLSSHDEDGNDFGDDFFNGENGKLFLVPTKNDGVATVIIQTRGGDGKLSTSQVTGYITTGGEKLKLPTFTQLGS